MRTISILIHPNSLTNPVFSPKVNAFKLRKYVRLVQLSEKRNLPEKIMIFSLGFVRENSPFWCIQIVPRIRYPCSTEIQNF